MAFLHQTIIPYKTKALLRKSNSPRRSMNFRQVKLVGILFTMNNLDEYEAIRQFESKLKKEGKEVVVLCYLPKNVENFDFHYDIFSNKDFNFWGNPEAGNLQAFISKPFDLLICLDRTPNLYLEFLLAASKQGLRIGPFLNKEDAPFELMINEKKERPLQEFIHQIYHYTNEL